MKRLLIISFYWPPASGPGVQRVLSFAKYLQEWNYSIFVFTAKNNTQLGEDKESRYPFLNRMTVFSTTAPFIGSGKQKASFSENRSLSSKIKNWLRGNLLIPDAKIFWYLNSKRKLKQIIEQEKIELVLVSGPPQSSHLLGRWLKVSGKIKVIHDFRDPWTDAFFLKDFHRSFWAKKLDEKCERLVLKNADAIITVSKEIADSLSQKSGMQVHVIENGFDTDLLDAKKPDAMEFIYTGNFDESYYPEHFFNCIDLNREIHCHFYGTMHSTIYEKIKQHRISENIHLHPSVPHIHSLTIQANADFLLLCIPRTANNLGIVTGKLFEYISRGRPILAFGPEEGAAARILEECRVGNCFDYSRPIVMKDIQNLLASFNPDREAILRYHRRNLSKKLEKIIEQF